MRVVLLYPPPWKIPEPSEAADLLDGPPPDYQPGDLDADFHQTPYGLFSLAAQAIRAGHQVKVLNLSTFTWKQTMETLDALEAEVFGMSCWTANRRGVGLIASALKERHPACTIVVGGPHASPLASELLEHMPAVDLVSVGESEPQFLTLLSLKAQGKPLRHIPGTYFRDGDAIVAGPKQPAIANLDELESPHKHFATHIVMTSRGCPWQCTFCGAETTWGRGFRGQSIDYVLDAIENALARVPVRMLLIKDDTFTANKKRALALCEGIRKRKLNFLWSCDTRVDVLTPELLHAMRLAGCQRLSLGVESGSPQILKAIDKKLTPEKILRATEMAKAVGIQVRFYMMLGNRGETRESFEETLRFLEDSKPHQYLFSCLSIYPGTVDFHDAERAGWLDRDVYFTQPFQELKVPFDVSEEDSRHFSRWFEEHKGLHRPFRENSEQCRAILQRLGEHHAAHLDLAGAYYREGELELATEHARKALVLELPVPGLAHNLLACIAARRFDLDALQHELKTALRTDPYHFAVAKNAEALRRWLVSGGPAKNLPLKLDPEHEFSLFERTVQPVLPGPLEQDFARWDPAPTQPPGPPGPQRKLPVLVVP